MSISDNYSQPRKSGPMVFNQPWVNFAEPGERFLETTTTAHEQGRPVMVLGEISQAEVWDPVCGCDGITYPNACGARAAGVPEFRDGECEAKRPE